jgi:hypothetical protein
MFGITRVWGNNFGADLLLYATDSGRRRSCELKTVLPIYMQIEREDC